MAANIPAGLKSAAITPFLVRGAQLEKAKPIISYWCNYMVVNRILAEKLHHTNEECLNFTMALMDKLEQIKTEEGTNDAIHDDLAGQTYVEQFADETMERAMRPLRANKVTQQTALTFEAAATFFQLLNVWGALRPEIEKKVQYAKWNAVRILRAIKAGEDPNESNPKPQEDQLEELDPNDPEAQAMGLIPAPTVEDAPDQGEPNRLDPRASAASPATVSAPTSPPPGSAPTHEQVSPIAPPDQPATGGYFPSTPALTGDEDPLQLPSAPGAAPGAPPAVGDPDLSIPSPPTVLPDLERRSPTLPAQDPMSPPTLPDTPNSFYRPPPPAQQPSASAPAPPPQNYPPSQPTAPPSHSVYSQQPPQPFPPPSDPPTASAPPPAAAPAQPVQSYSGGPPTNAVYNADDMAMAQAQKHAKWAISALNFEDVPTAVRELKAALAQLGAN